MCVNGGFGLLWRSPSVSSGALEVIRFRLPAEMSVLRYGEIPEASIRRRSVLQPWCCRTCGPRMADHRTADIRAARRPCGSATHHSR